jgi:hypothetical protein
MNAKTHHDFHPDAESLSAFAEQALGERERGQVLKHLAVCARCREVVALAHNATVAEVAPAASVRAAIQPRAWWRSWQLAWVPSAALAAAVAITVFVHMRNVEQNAEIARNEGQAITGSATAPAVPAPQGAQPVQAAPPAAAPVAAKSPARSAKREAAGAAHNPPSQEFGVTSAMPAEPGAIEHMEDSREETAPASQEFAGNGTAPDRTTAAYTPQPAVTAWQQGQRQKATAGAASSHLYAGSTPAPAGVHATEGAAAGSSTGQVTVSSDRLQAQAQPAARFAQMNQPPSAAIDADAMKAIHLPGGLPAVSTAEAGHRRLAIDQAGALFLSLDAGNHWKIVAQQWTGRAVNVRCQMTSNGTETEPTQLFELFNDQSQIWLSTDGETWIAK